jgi:hypothetical protein
MLCPLASHLLQGLRSKLRQPLQGFNIVVMAYRHPLHPIPPHQLPPEGVATCMRVLVVAEGPFSHVVKNVLIDHSSIECTVGVLLGVLRYWVGAWAGVRMCPLHSLSLVDRATASFPVFIQLLLTCSLDGPACPPACLLSCPPT